MVPSVEDIRRAVFETLRRTDGDEAVDGNGELLTITSAVASPQPNTDSSLEPWFRDAPQRVAPTRSSRAARTSMGVAWEGQAHLTTGQSPTYLRHGLSPTYGTPSVHRTRGELRWRFNKICMPWTDATKGPQLTETLSDLHQLVAGEGFEPSTFGL